MVGVVEQKRFAVAQVMAGQREAHSLDRAFVAWQSVTVLEPSVALVDSWVTIAGKVAVLVGHYIVKGAWSEKLPHFA